MGPELRWWSMAWAAALLLWALGCGGARSNGDVPVAPEPKPRNADRIARELVGGQVGALIFAERLRDHPVGAQIETLDPWRAILEGTDIDPRRDLVRAYATAPTVQDEDHAVLVAEHELPEPRVREALGVLVERSKPEGQWLDEAAVPAARVIIRGRTRVVALVAPNVLVVLPESLAAQASRFAGTGGLPVPSGPEAVIADAVDPARTVRARHLPPIPATLRELHATVTPAADGGVDLYIEAPSSSAEQARADAQSLSREVDRKLSVKIFTVRVRLFDGIDFRADGDRVKGERHLSQAELESIFAFVDSVMRR